MDWLATQSGHRRSHRLPGVGRCHGKLGEVVAEPLEPSSRANYSNDVAIPWPVVLDSGSQQLIVGTSLLSDSEPIGDLSSLFL